MGTGHETGVDGPRGYGVDAEALVQRYEQVRPAEKYAFARHLIPAKPCRVMDVGAGSGVDASWLASLGHQVVAVEPTFELRLRAAALHPSKNIRWMDDCLPHLRSVMALNEAFDFVVVAGVWTHLDEMQRRESLQALTSLLSPEAVALISIRQGVAPTSRLTFPVTVADEVASAQSYGLRTIINMERQSLQAANDAAGVTWRWLALQPSHEES
jgi:2-polyprenyl-3-methyl-5-hydroxy-6-metoxy-1,4-benzoquinol methylase